MYESTLSQNIRQPDGAYAERPCSENAGGGGGNFTRISTLMGSPSSTTPAASNLILLRSNNGMYTLPNMQGNQICLDPVVSFGDLSGLDNYAVTFTPSEAFITPENAHGDTVTPGDGKTYYMHKSTDNPQSGVFWPKILKKTNDFISDIQ